MKTIYLVRHGQAENNVKGTPYYVAEGAKLTNLGRAQGGFIAERAAALPVQALITSNFVRAQETAQIISERIHIPVEICELFGERRGPTALVGMPWLDPETQRIETEWLRTFYEPDLKVADSENFNDIHQRARNASNT
jgi:broad specificity phosphatase PhoE